VTSAVATVTGALTLALVLVIGAAARRPPRRMPAAVLDGRRRSRRSAPRAIVAAAVAVLTGGALAAIGPGPVVVTGGVVIALARRHHVTAARARQRAIDAALPDAVELLVMCVSAGCSPTQAVVLLAARAPPALRAVFAEVELRLHRGRSLAEALGALTAAGPMGRDVASAIAAADRDGLPLAPVLDRLATEARAARRRQGEADARRLPVRLTFPLVLCTLPSFVLLAIAPAVLGALSTLRAATP